MDSLDGYVSDDELAIAPLCDLGWEVETVSWRDNAANWNDFDIVVIRTTWDYQSEPAAFLNILEKIEASDARLENPLDVVEWNLDKRYLRELSKKGVNIVPTIWDGQYDEEAFGKWRDEFATDDLIIKPTVSATAEHTYRMGKFDPLLTDGFRTRPFMVQPFLQSIVTEGEYSLFYMGSEYSHTILKSPKAADFRVQEEHGGLITAVRPTDQMLDAGREIFDMIRPTPLYARVDLVRDEAGRFALMELELIEPALYLRMDAEAPQRFAAAINNCINKRNGIDATGQSR